MKRELNENELIPIARVNISEKALELIRSVLESGWVTQGPVTARFEAEFARRCGSRFAIAVTSATTGLHLTFNTLGLKPGDEVIVPSFTFVASANAIIHAQGMPRFADVSPDTFNMRAADVESCITPRTKAVLLIHQFGMPADIEEIRALCKMHNLWLVEDAACALGSSINSRLIGDGETPAVFSFHPRKIITTGEGGMIVTNSESFAEGLRSARFHGARFSSSPAQPFESVVGEQFVMAGYNGKMSDILAAVGIEQLDHLDDFLHKRQQLGRAYNEAFLPIDGVTIQNSISGAVPNYQSYYIILRNKEIREKLLRELASIRVTARRGIPAIHRMPYIEKLCGRFELPVTDRLSECGLFLPIFPGLTEEVQQRIIDVVKRTVQAK